MFDLQQHDFIEESSEASPAVKRRNIIARGNALGSFIKCKAALQGRNNLLSLINVVIQNLAASPALIIFFYHKKIMQQLA